MMLSRFKALIIAHIAVLLLIMATGVYFVLRHDNAPVVGVLMFFFVAVIWSLFFLVNKTNRQLASFLMSIKYDDFATTYASRQDEGSEKELYGAFNLISGKFRDIRLEKEIQFQYFQSLVEQVETGLIGFDDNGKTIFMNRALKHLIHKSHFSSFDAIRKFDPELAVILDRIKPGERELLKRSFSQNTIELAIQKTILNIKGQTYSFFSFQNIHEELQAQEVNSWHKLIRILTHEIMNSVSPVVSLANSTNDLLNGGEDLTPEQRDEVRIAIAAIQKRSEGLMHFTSTYRQLTKLPAPKIEDLDARELMERIAVLMEPGMNERDIELQRHFGKQRIRFKGDPELLEQAFINLIKNAIEALNCAEKKIVRLELEAVDGSVVFRISDTGPGIAPEVLDQVFVPFFTTKDEGSGIGLSLCRQIVQSHGGSVSAFSEEDAGTVFTITI
jgi:nitrogen fixation/metabolism regulation signal transduction histidine kinase